MKYFFIIGAPKTGTTLLARLIDSHPEIACTTELFPFHMKGGKRKLNPNIAKKWKDHGFDFAKCDFNHVKKRINIDSYIKDDFIMLLRAFGRRCNASIVGDKFPWYIGFIDDMLEMFPDAHYIYNVRDPRAVWNSAKNFTHVKRADSLLKQMLNYDKKIEKYQKATPLPAKFWSLSFEDLVNDTDFELRSLFTFLEQHTNPELQTEPKYPARFKGIPNSTEPLNPAICTKWKTQMTAKEINRVTKMSMGFIKKYGYGGE